MTRIFWDTILLISGTFSMSVVLNGSLFTFGAGHSGSAIIDAGVAVDTNSTAAAVNATAAGRTVADGRASTAVASLTSTTDLPPDKNSLFGFGADRGNASILDVAIAIDANSTSPNASATEASRSKNGSAAASASSAPPVKKFVAAAVRSHFDDCPDSHRHFCFHGTCRFLILEDTPACVCHPGFVGMRCEHADLLAVVATNHRQQTVATVLVLCVIGCVLIMLLCTLLNCWWRQECRRRGRAHHYIQEKSVNMLKHGASRYPPESVV